MVESLLTESGNDIGLSGGMLDSNEKLEDSELGFSLRSEVGTEIVPPKGLFDVNKDVKLEVSSLLESLGS